MAKRSNGFNAAPLAAPAANALAAPTAPASARGDADAEEDDDDASAANAAPPPNCVAVVGAETQTHASHPRYHAIGFASGNRRPSWTQFFSVCSGCEGEGEGGEREGGKAVGVGGRWGMGDDGDGTGTGRGRDGDGTATGTAGFVQSSPSLGTRSARRRAHLLTAHFDESRERADSGFRPGGERLARGHRGGRRRGRPRARRRVMNADTPKARNTLRFRDRQRQGQEGSDRPRPSTTRTERRALGTLDPRGCSTR
jgi:hypothetical protein